LAEAEPTSLQELFSRNPETYTDSQLDLIIMRMRELRVKLEESATPPRHARIRDDAVDGPNGPKERKPREPKRFDFSGFGGA